ILAWRPLPPAGLAGRVAGVGRGIETPPGRPAHPLAGAGPADADRAGAEPAGVRSMGVGPDDQGAREGVLLQHDLMNDAGARAPEARAVFGGGRAQKVIDLLILVERLPKVGSAFDPALDEMVAVDG